MLRTSSVLNKNQLGLESGGSLSHKSICSLKKLSRIEFRVAGACEYGMVVDGIAEVSLSPPTKRFVPTTNNGSDGGDGARAGAWRALLRRGTL